MGGRRIPPPRSRGVRPTPDSIRESLFNLLPPLRGCNFLDLYAGTGIVGIEALSRGARQAVFVEKLGLLGRSLKELLAAWGLEQRSRVLTMDVSKGMHALTAGGERFDIVFADPPYERALVGKTITYCCRGRLMAAGGVLIVQRSVREDITPDAGERGLILKEERRYGDTVLTFFEHTVKESC